MRPVTLTIRTANRAPTRNYLGRTVTGLLRAGVQPADIHLVVTDADARWLDTEIGSLPVCRHVPTVPRNPNENGRAQVDVLEECPADWLLMLEDDVEVCADFLGSVTRWLSDHAVPAVHVYRFCAFGPVLARRAGAWEYALREQRGSQAIALRADEARLFARWSAEHHTNWRPAMAPFQNQRTNGFDKLVGYWALSQWPRSDRSYVSAPQMVRHVGMASSLHRHRPSIENPGFAGTAWRYASRVA